MTYTVPEADEVVETTVAEAMPEESESEKVDSKEVDSKEVDSKKVDSEETVTEVDDTQEPVTEKNPACCAKCGAPLEEDALFCTSCGARVQGSYKEAEIRLKETVGGILEKRK